MVIRQVKFELVIAKQGVTTCLACLHNSSLAKGHEFIVEWRFDTELLVFGIYLLFLYIAERGRYDSLLEVDQKVSVILAGPWLIEDNSPLNPGAKRKVMHAERKKGTFYIRCTWKSYVVRPSDIYISTGGIYMNSERVS